MSYEPLLKRIAELRKAAEPIADIGSEQWADARRANKALAAPAHEMAACVTALEEATSLMQVAVDNTYVSSLGEFERTITHMTDALDALAKVML